MDVCASLVKTEEFVTTPSTHIIVHTLGVIILRHTLFESLFLIRTEYMYHCCKVLLLFTLPLAAVPTPEYLLFHFLLFPFSRFVAEMTISRG